MGVNRGVERGKGHTAHDQIPKQITHHPHRLPFNCFIRLSSPSPCSSQRSPNDRYPHRMEHCQPSIRESGMQRRTCQMVD